MTADAFTHLYLPASSPGAPTLLLLHGTGGDERDLLELGRHLHPEAAILSPRGKVTEAGMARFFRRLAPGVLDLEDLKVRTDELADFVLASAGTYVFDPKRVIAVGYSNGANIAASMLLLRPPILAGAALFRPMLPITPEALPDLGGKRAFVALGKTDQVTPPASGEALAELLRTCTADVEVRYEQAGHELTPGDIEAAVRWMRRDTHAASG